MQSAILSASTLSGSTSLDELKNYDNNGNDEENVNQTSHRVTAHQPQRPQNDQYHNYCPQHEILLPEMTINFSDPGFFKLLGFIFAAVPLLIIFGWQQWNLVVNKALFSPCQERHRNYCAGEYLWTMHVQDIDYTKANGKRD
jgi:hypothetical protein